MSKNQKVPVDLEDLDDEAIHGGEAPTSVGQVSRELLESLRRPERAPAAPKKEDAPTLPPPPNEAPSPVAAAAAAASDEEASQDDVYRDGEIATAVVVIGKISPPAGIPRPAPIPSIDRFATETEGSPDEDPSDTAMSAEIPANIPRRPSAHTRAAAAARDAPLEPGAPMFEPPPPEMLAWTPPPPPPSQPLHIQRPSAGVPPIANVASKARPTVWIVVSAAALVLLAAGLGVAFYVLRI